MRRKDKEFYPRMNRIMEGLAKTSLSENDGRYCWALFRKTFGYGEYEYKISRDIFEEMTGISGCNVSHTKKRLLDRRIIFCNNKLQGFNLDIEAWKKVSLSTPFKKVLVATQKGVDRAEKKGVAIYTPLSTKRKNCPKKGSCYAKLSGKEIDKLELDDWYRAIMFNQGKFSIYYIEGTIDDYPYDTRMSCWYLYEEAKDIRDKEAYFSKLLDNYAKEKK